jgi:hypothetical protein
VRSTRNAAVFQGGARARKDDAQRAAARAADGGVIF